MFELKMDMIQTISLSVILLIIGMRLRTKIKFFEKYCIPSPVIGGFLFSIIAFILRQTNIITIKFETTLQTFFMVMFFTSVGFNASLKVLKKGGKKVLIFLFLAIGLCFAQNVVAIFLSQLIGINPLLGLMTGSTPMTGGHGTSAAIAPTIEALGIKGAGTVAIASATFGLIAGSMMGGPIANKLILKHKLLGNETLLHEKHDYNSDIDENVLKKPEPALNAERFSMAFFFILIAMGIGSYLSIFITKLLPAMNFPIYIGPMIIAAIMRNISDNSEMFTAPTREISVLEDVSLNLFLAMALMSLKLWELIDLAIPMLILLVAQVVLIYLYLNFITFKAMGSDYDAAVIVSGHCGFGLGATPNGISNMKSVCEKYKYSKIAFFVVPVVGALFIDFANVSLITLFISFFK
ncbi:sodium/glutamate symporter [Leptotrichia sp. oral taxon 212]|jgi:sodium/glutamate symporter|uniref:sodium/glutamate symporter n=1 Tax=Leptotrichia sp. oral taxon 212 TaxID=712357 RepID=UPI0006A9F864|nr:sodium/glutamate symporter [Leptotrichia sp. oral taxon 212]ALA95087.1 sodium:glutamate symporter [Leptotrichia sp. oral taxon 212]